MIDTLIETLPLPQRLALAYAPRRSRDDVLALLALNVRLSGIVRQQGEPVIAQMKLAWWRDRFAQDPGEWPLGEPLLALLKGWRGNVRALGPLVDCWEGLLAETLGEEEVSQFAEAHGAAWALLADSGREDAAHNAGAQWALADLAMHLSDSAERQIVEGKLSAIRSGNSRLGRQLRPLAVLRALTLRALDRQSPELLDGPGAMLLALRTGLAGR